VTTAARSTTTALLERLTTTYEAKADPTRAAAMRTYMRDQFEFLGIPTPLRRTLDREIVAGLPVPTEAELRTVALACFALEAREYQYFACDYLRRHVERCSPRFLTTARRLVTTLSWWDTVDALATRTVGGLVLAHRDLATTMDGWVRDRDIWVARTAILHQLTYRDRTDADRLFGYCLARADSSEFFLRKAIGWALREYSKTDAAAVRRFVRDHDRELSGLSKREALKWLERSARTPAR
jgi:3-methyladenine DNA glycosylase AlkD